MRLITRYTKRRNEQKRNNPETIAIHGMITERPQSMLWHQFIEQHHTNLKYEHAANLFTKGVQNIYTRI